MPRLREWVTIVLPTQLSAWLLAAYRRPLRFLLGLVLGPILVVSAATYAVNVELARRQALQHLAVTARLAAQAIDETLNDVLLFEQLLAVSPGFAEAVQRRDTSFVDGVLERLGPLAPGGDLVTVLGLDGRVLASWPRRRELLGRDVSQEDAFRGAAAGDWAPYVSSVYLREVAWAEKLVGVTAPLQHDGQATGLLQVQYGVETARTWLQRIRVEPEGFLYVVDQRDQLVFHPYQVLPGLPKPVGHWPPVATAAAQDGRTLAYRDPQLGEPWLAGVHPVGTTGWRVVAVQPEPAAVRALHRVLGPMGVLVGFLMLLLVGVSLQWVQLQESSLRLLRQNTKLLRQMQQRRTLEKGRPGKGSAES